MVSHFREQRDAKFKIVLDFCCPGNRQKEAICLQEGGCGEKEETCLFLRVKLPWLKAGILTVGDDSIKKKIHALNDAYGMMFRHRNDESEKAKKKREEYAVENKKTFDISKKDARNLIKNDPDRSSAAWYKYLPHFRCVKKFSSGADLFRYFKDGAFSRSPKVKEQWLVVALNM